MKISIACLLLNLGISAALVLPLHQGGLGIANTLTSGVNVALLTFALRKKLARLDLEPLRKTFLPLAAAGLAAALTAWLGGRWWDHWERSRGHVTITLKIGAVFAPALLAGLVYLGLALAFRVPAAREMWGMVHNRGRKH